MSSTTGTTSESGITHHSETTRYITDF